MDLEDIDINEEWNEWDPINREFKQDITITSEDDGRGYEVVTLNRDELAYKSEVKLTGYCNAENDQNNNLWVTMESPFLTKKITQKFPLLPGYGIPENNTRAVGDNEIDITENGSYILGQNDEDLDDLEMNLDDNSNSNSNPQRSLNLSKTRDTIDPTYTLGKFNVNIDPPTITSPVTSNGYYKFDGNTLNPGTSSDYNLNVSVTTNPKINFKYISISGSTNYVIKDLSIATDIVLPGNSSAISIFYDISSQYYRINYNYNNKSSSVTKSSSYSRYYIIINDYASQIVFKDENGNIIYRLHNITYDTLNLSLELYKTNFNLV